MTSRTASRDFAHAVKRARSDSVGKGAGTVRANSPAPSNAPLPTPRALLDGLVELPELLLLRSVRVEILWRQPPFERGLPGRPLGFQHREPSGIAAAALDDHVVAENT